MSEKDKAVAAALQQIEKQHGKGAVMRLGDSTRTPVAAISTGCLGLDLAFSARLRLAAWPAASAAAEDAGSGAFGGRRFSMSRGCATVFAVTRRGL